MRKIRYTCHPLLQILDGQTKACPSTSVSCDGIKSLIQTMNMAYYSSSGVDDSNTTVDYYSATTATAALHPNNVIDGRLSSPYSIHLGLRKRDAVAIFVCLLLLRLAFAPNNNAVNVHNTFVSHSRVDASMILAFYYPFQSNADPERKYNEEDDNGNEAWRRRRTAQPTPLDMDGDGTFDSLVMPVFLTRENVRQEEELELTEMRARRRHHRKTVTATDQEFKRSNEWSKDGSWGLRILDLRPLHPSHNHENNDGAMIAYDGPFAPRTLFLTPLMPPSQHHSGNGEDASSQTQSQQQSDTTTTISKVYPIKLISIQIPMQRTHLGEEEKIRQRHKKDTAASGGSYGKNPNIPSKEDPLHRDYDRTRHYFCGSTWHHASQSCHRHCGGGLSSECGEGETCYADTPVSRRRRRRRKRWNRIPCAGKWRDEDFYCFDAFSLNIVLYLHLLFYPLLFLLLICSAMCTLNRLAMRSSHETRNLSLWH